MVISKFSRETSVIGGGLYNKNGHIFNLLAPRYYQISWNFNNSNPYAEIGFKDEEGESLFSFTDDFEKNVNYNLIKGVKSIQLNIDDRMWYGETIDKKVNSNFYVGFGGDSETKSFSISNVNVETYLYKNLCNYDGYISTDFAVEPIHDYDRVELLFNQRENAYYPFFNSNKSVCGNFVPLVTQMMNNNYSLSFDCLYNNNTSIKSGFLVHKYDEKNFYGCRLNGDGQAEWFNVVNGEEEVQEIFSAFIRPNEWFNQKIEAYPDPNNACTTIKYTVNNGDEDYSADTMIEPYMMLNTGIMAYKSTTYQNPFLIRNIESKEL